MIDKNLEKELQALAEKICRENNKVELPSIHLRWQRRGHTNESGFISIPAWAVSQGRAYLNYYLIHELTHWILLKSHCEQFRNKEKEILGQYGLGIIYSKVYAKKIFYNGKIVWQGRIK